MRKARRIRPTDPAAWPTEPASVPRPQLTSDTARALYTSRMAQQEGEWAEIDRILEQNRIHWRKRQPDRQRDLDRMAEVERQDQAEVET